MHIDELTRALHGARDAEPAADAATAREAVARRVRRHQTRRVAAIALCVLVLLGAFAITISRVGTRDPGYATSTQGMPKLVPSNLPDGLRIEVLAGQPGDVSPVPIDDVHVSVFAAPGATPPDDAFTVMKVRIGSTGPPGTGAPKSGSYDPAKVETDADGIRSTGRVEPDGSTILVVSPTMDGQTLTQIARSVRFLPSGEADVSSVPPGYDRVVSNARTLWLGTSLTSPLGTAGYAQLYTAPNAATSSTVPRSGPALSTEKSLTLSAIAAGPSDLDAARWAIPHAQSRTVRGHPGVSGSHEIAAYSATVGSGSVSDTSRSTPTSGTAVPASPSAPDPAGRRTVVGSYQVVAWMENDTTLVQLSSPSYSIDELARMAEGLRVDPTDFRDLEAATTTTTLGENCQRTAGGGTICHTQSQGSVGGSGSCTTEAPPATTADGGGRTVMTCQATAIDPGNMPTTTAQSPPTVAPTAPPTSP